MGLDTVTHFSPVPSGLVALGSRDTRSTSRPLLSPQGHGAVPASSWADTWGRLCQTHGPGHSHRCPSCPLDTGRGRAQRPFSGPRTQSSCTSVPSGTWSPTLTHPHASVPSGSQGLGIYDPCPMGPAVSSLPPGSKGGMLWLVEWGKTVKGQKESWTTGETAQLVSNVFSPHCVVTLLRLQQGQGRAIGTAVVVLGGPAAAVGGSPVLDPTPQRELSVLSYRQEHPRVHSRCVRRGVRSP